MEGAGIEYRALLESPGLQMTVSFAETLDHPDYWQTVVVRKLELYRGPFHGPQGCRSECLLLVPVPARLSVDYSGDGVEPSYSALSGSTI